MKSKEKKHQKSESINKGKLRIGDNWNAITIIALSQTNPLKAIAEFVENSIDASAKNITIVRGRERGEYYLKIIDDGTGIPLDHDGIPDFKYVATHICDSIKKRLKKEGKIGIQGEFGIGLLSFWIVGERLILTCAGSDNRTYQMEMRKNKPGYTITKKRSLFAYQGTELVIHPLLPGIRQLTGEKIQNYLASELRDRIRKSDVFIKIKDRTARKEFIVKPRNFTGRLLHDFSPVQTKEGEIYFELYLNSYNPDNIIHIARLGTRVLSNITILDRFRKEPWTTGYIQGMIDVPFLTLTPGTRDGIVQDNKYALFVSRITRVEEKLKEIIEQEKKAEEEKASQDILKSVKKAFKEAFLALSRDEYNWLDIYSAGKNKKKKPGIESTMMETNTEEAKGIPEKSEELVLSQSDELKFFEHAGPLYKAIISPSSAVVKVNSEKRFRVFPRDRSRRIIEHGIDVVWEIKDGGGSLENIENEVVIYKAPDEPGITILQVVVAQDASICSAEAIITVSDSLINKDKNKESEHQKGLPGYTFKRAPGQLWRSRYDKKNNIIIINNGHADYIYASKKRTLKLKYICKLYAKELVLNNFIGYSTEDLLEHMVELSMYTEEYLK